MAVLIEIVKCIDYVQTITRNAQVFVLKKPAMTAVTRTQATVINVKDCVCTRYAAELHRL